MELSLWAWIEKTIHRVEKHWHASKEKLLLLNSFFFFGGGGQTVLQEKFTLFIEWPVCIHTMFRVMAKKKKKKKN